MKFKCLCYCEGAGLGPRLKAIRLGFIKIAASQPSVAPRNDKKRAVIASEAKQSWWGLAKIATRLKALAMTTGKAFTLAEVLITLAIIGVIAAMTIPSVIAKYQELETVSKVKKFYSTMSNALQLAIRDNGTVDEWEYSKEKDPETGYYSSDSFVENLKPYLKLAKDCGSKPDEGCIYDGKYKLLDGSEWSDYNKSEWYYKMVLLDGSAMWIRTQVTEHCESSTDGCAIIWYDINGIKEPNMIGKDVFTFIITSNNIYPNGTNVGGVLYNNYSNFCKGWQTAQYVLQNGNMDYLKECTQKNL